jgi:signal transduction histidine kinase/CheY-like chemotaxis protein
VDIAVSPLAPVGGAVIRLDDVTEQVRKEEQLRRVQRMDTVSLLAGGLAHDFNNVLVAITGTVSSLRLELEKATPDRREIDECIDTVEQASARAADLVRSLLGLSRKREPSFARQDLAKLVASTVKLCRGTFGEGVGLALEVPKTPVLVRADATQVHEVLLNLCINGWHAMTVMRPEGAARGGQLSVTLTDVTLDAAFCAMHPAVHPGRWARVSVRDTGVGMDAATRERIFDPFFSTKGEGQGTGLGLAVAFTIVQQHGGFIDVHSEPGEGADFRVYLPLDEDGARAVPGEAPERSGLVLVVDDQPLLLKVATNTLQELGYRVETAGSGEQALAAFAADPGRFDLVLLDLGMPGLPGLKVLQEMRAVRPGTRVLVESGLDADPRFEQALAKFEGTVLAVVHDRYFIERFATDVWTVENGGIQKW